MKKCNHECDDCGETWECSYPYNSEFQFFRNVVNSGSYCNSYCPTCKDKERSEIDNLFENTYETGYLKSTINKVNGHT